MTETYEDLWDALPKGFTSDNYCGSNGEYLKWEKEVETQLKNNGFVNLTWRTGESDSFGPLSRILTAVDPYGNDRRFIYG